MIFPQLIIKHKKFISELPLQEFPFPPKKKINKNVN